MKSQYKVIDNFLPTEDFNKLVHTIKWIPFFFTPDLNDNQTNEDKSFQMTHPLFVLTDDQPTILSEWFENFRIVYDKLNAKSLIRMKINFYPHTDTVKEHPKHCDYDFEHKSLIFSLNTCNGSTVLEDGMKIKSVANRALLFDGSKPHNSTTCSDDKVRVNVNINYF